MRYAQKRTYLWSPKIAYSVGLMASDGCLQSDGRHLDLTSVDIMQLENFQKAMGRKLTISKKQNLSARQAYRIQFSDVAYYDFLLKAGLTPAKSKSLKELLIPDAYYSHFFRGLFDGDGTSYGFQDKRWRSSYVYSLSIISASKPFLMYLARKNQEIFGVHGAAIRKSSRAYCLVYGKVDTLSIYEHMYANAGNLYLERKKLRLDCFINTDKMLQFRG